MLASDQKRAIGVIRLTTLSGKLDLHLEAGAADGQLLHDCCLTLKRVGTARKEERRGGGVDDKPYFNNKDKVGVV